MDFYTRDHHSHFSSQSHSGYEIPSFEEAFDPESLRRFYRQQNTSIFAKNICSMEEESNSQTFEALSPTTTQSQSPIDYQRQHFGETQVTPGRGPKNAANKSSQGTMNTFKAQLDMQKGKAKKTGAESGANKVKKVEEKKEEETGDMIASLFHQIQSYYTEAPSNAEVIPPVGQVTRKSSTQAGGKKTKARKGSGVKSEEDRLDDGVLNRLIRKKSVFVIQRKKVGQIVRKNSTSQGANKQQQKKTIPVQLQQTQPLTNYNNDLQGDYFSFTPQMVAQEPKEDQGSKMVSADYQARPALLQFDLKLSKPEVVKKNVFANIFSNSKNGSPFDFDADYLS